MAREDQIKKAAEIIAYGCSDELKTALIKDFPELKESEDERIRKRLVDCLKVSLKGAEEQDAAGCSRQKDIEAYKWGIAYLEKQKEQKQINNIIAKAFENSKTDYPLEEREKASDYSERVLPTSITCGEDEDEYRLHKVIEAAYIAGQQEQKPAEWSEEDTCILEDAVTAVDLLGNDDEYSKTHPNLAKAFRVAKDWLKSLPERFNLQPKQEWNEEDKKRVVELKTFIAQCNGFNKANRKKAFEMIDALYPQPTQEWSAEDEEILDAMIDMVSNSLYEPLCPREGMLAWLKSLRPHPHWKPSEEQMEALSDAYVEASTFKKGNILESLYEDLKKL